MKNIDKLGKQFSTLGFGGASLSGEGKGYGFGEISESQVVEVLLKAFDKGVNLFDFAPIYGHNLAEIRAGKAFKNYRDKVYLVSKSGVGWHENGRVNMSNDPKMALKMLDQSLKNFQSDYIDIYMVHWPDKRIDIRHCLEVLFNAKEKGKITHIGLCNTNLEDLQKAKEVCPVDVVQMEANLFNQNSLNSLRPGLEAHMLTLGWGTYDKGILTGSVSLERKYDPSDCRSWAPWWKKGDWKQKVEFVQKVQRKYSLKDEDLSHIAFSCGQELVDVTLCGMKKTEHIKRNLEYIEYRPSKLKEVSLEFASY